MFSEHAARFNDALAAGDHEKAMKAAEGMRDCGHPLELRPAIDLLSLLFHNRDERAERMAARWLKRVKAEEDLSDPEVAIAAAAVEGMKDPSTAWRCEKILRLLAIGAR